MGKIKALFKYFTTFEKVLWCSSIVLIIASFCVFDRCNYLTLIASLVGVTSLIFCAKGNPAGQILMIIFSILYGIISLSFAYYGEMITYLGMTLPLAIFALVSWLKNPYKGNKSEVKVSKLSKKSFIVMCILTIIVTIVFYFILEALNTSNLIVSTISVTTSFMAAFLTFKRSPYYALLYAFNDVVLIILWILASIKNSSYISIVVCFFVFLVNDLYCFFNWLKMSKRQNKAN